MLSFAYTDAGAMTSATFTARGAIPPDSLNDLFSQPWVGGAVSPTTAYAAIGASIPRSSSVRDMISIGIALKAPGSSPIDPNCRNDSSDCTAVFVLFDTSRDGTSPLHACALGTGTVTISSISSISSTRITGSFSGTGQCFSSIGGPGTPFSVSEGTFNVAARPRLP